MNFGKGKTPWYYTGLCFECSQCGQCCAGPEQGYIWVSRPEIRLIADFLKMPVKAFKRQFMRRVGFRFTIIEDPQSRDCVFLSQTEHGKRCAIYQVRPSQCRNWPFWERNLESPKDWNSAALKCPGLNRGRLYTPEQIQEKSKNIKWWKTNPLNPSIVKKEDASKLKIIACVSEIYKWLDEQLIADNSRAGDCFACGKCCDFEKYGHRLYVTSPEMIYFVENTGSANIKQMVGGRCPYQIDNKCSVYTHRFAGCRIFCCRGEAGFQSELTEEVIRKFKAICEEFDVPYQYMELPAADKK